MNLFQTDRPLSWQACLACGEEMVETDPRTRCPCGGLLEVRHRVPSATGDALRRFLDGRLGYAGPLAASGVWRFRELVMPGIGSEEIVSHPEGLTPLLSRAAVSRWAGVPTLRLKHEGHNPTGSFKDRGMTVAVTQAVRTGARAVACASTGNTAASLAAYAAQAGLPAYVLMPAGKVAMGKLAQTIAYGARTIAVRGDFDACLRLLEAVAPASGVYLANSVNPYRVEGQKTIVFDLLQQMGWEPPDWIVLPAGNLGNTAAFGKALEEARGWGLIDRMPRVAAIQAEGAAPFAAGFDEGFATRHRVQAETVATAIRIGDPASWDRGVRTIRLTDGVVARVSDAEILAAKAVIDRAGVGCEPASAASVAGVRKLVANGTIPPGASVVAVLTGHVLKDPEILLRTAASGGPVEVDATEDAIRRALMQEAPGN
ncbi:MAG: threonine synthase [Gemmatimonadota bacterium]